MIPAHRNTTQLAQFHLVQVGTILSYIMRSMLMFVVLVCVHGSALNAHRCQQRHQAESGVASGATKTGAKSGKTGGKLTSKKSTVS